MEKPSGSKKPSGADEPTMSIFMLTEVMGARAGRSMAPLATSATGELRRYEWASQGVKEPQGVAGVAERAGTGAGGGATRAQRLTC